MQATGTQAILPKARGMFAKRITPAEYEELMRRRTVPEVAALLKRHPYFQDSLASLSTADPHRGQIEELLSMDIFNKYEALIHYDFSGDGFSGYYRTECEMREIMKALHLLSIGVPGGYMNQIPGYLVGKTRIDLFALGQAMNFAQVVEVCRGTVYYKALRARYLADPYLRDFPATEAALLRQAYASLFELVDRALSGRDADEVRNLFLQECEVYNLELLLRIRAFFPHTYTADEIRGLTLPYSYRVPKRVLTEMINAQSVEALMALLRQTQAIRYTGAAKPEDLAAAGGRAIYRNARQVLHLASSPAASLAAFLSLAKLTRENVVNIIEGVRYQLSPEQIRPMLRL